MTTKEASQAEFKQRPPILGNFVFVFLCAWLTVLLLLAFCFFHAATIVLNLSSNIQTFGFSLLIISLLLKRFKCFNKYYQIIGSVILGVNVLVCAFAVYLIIDDIQFLLPYW